eukprot:scaffold129_cov254-Pinguiococcus_pyrenoidosus.AAC.14
MDAIGHDILGHHRRGDLVALLNGVLAEARVPGKRGLRDAVVPCHRRVHGTRDLLLIVASEEPNRPREDALNRSPQILVFLRGAEAQVGEKAQRRRAKLHRLANLRAECFPHAKLTVVHRVAELPPLLHGQRSAAVCMPHQLEQQRRCHGPHLAALPVVRTLQANEITFLGEDVEEHGERLAHILLQLLGCRSLVISLGSKS